MFAHLFCLFFFFFNDTATTEIYTLSLHDALPICQPAARRLLLLDLALSDPVLLNGTARPWRDQGYTVERSEEHTSELQSLAYLVCRLLLEKKKNKTYMT